MAIYDPKSVDLKNCLIRLPKEELIKALNNRTMTLLLNRITALEIDVKELNHKFKSLPKNG